MWSCLFSRLKTPLNHCCHSVPNLRRRLIAGENALSACGLRCFDNDRVGLGNDKVRADELDLIVPFNAERPLRNGVGAHILAFRSGKSARNHNVLRQAFQGIAQFGV